MALTKREQEMLTLAVKKPSILKLADDEILKSKDFFLEAAVINPDVLKYADKSLKESKWLAERLISNNGMTYRYFGRTIKGDTGFALAAIKSTHEVAPYILKNVQQDISKMYSRGKSKISRNLALFFAQTIDMQLHEYIGDFTNDKEVMLLAVKHCGSNIRSASPRLQMDLDIVKVAYKQNPYVFREGYLEKSKALIINDRDFIIEVVRESEHTCIEPEYADDEEIAMIALDKSVRMYMNLSDRLHDREDIARMVIAKDAELLNYASKRLQKDRKFIESVVVTNPAVLEYVPSHWLKDKDYIIDVLSNVSTKDNKISVLELLSKKFADDEEIVAACVAANAADFRHASKRLQNSPDFALKLMMTYELDLTKYLSKEVLADEEVAEYLKQQDFKKRFGL